MSRNRPLPTGISTTAENIFIKMAQMAFDHVEGFDWDSNPNSSEIFIASEESDIEQESLPQIRISVGDLQDYKGAIDHLKDWDVNVSEHIFVDQAYVNFSCYSSNDVEARDMADFLKTALFRARKWLGKQGVFSLRKLSSTKPKQIEQGARESSVLMSSTTAAFMTVRKATWEETERPVWYDTDLTHRRQNQTVQVGPGGEDPEPPRLQKAELAPSRKEAHLLFSAPLAPYMPSGFSAEATGPPGENGPMAIEVRRPAGDESRLVIRFLDGPVGLGQSVNLKYEPGNLSDYHERAFAEAFEESL